MAMAVLFSHSPMHLHDAILGAARHQRRLSLRNRKSPHSNRQIHEFLAQSISQSHPSSVATFRPDLF